MPGFTPLPENLMTGCHLQRMLLGGLLILAPALQASAQVTFSGFVRDGVTAEPLSGATMSLYQHSSPFSGETVDTTVSAADGSYTMSNTLGSMNLRIFTALPGYANSSVFIGSAGGSAVTRDIDLYPEGNGTFEVTVVDATSGEPQSGVTIYFARDSVTASPSTGSDGRISVSLPSQRYSVCTSDYEGGRYLNQCFDGLPSPPYTWSTAPKQLLLPDERLSLRFALTKGAVISGVVRDRQTGEPLANRRVSLQFVPAAGGIVQGGPATLDSNGRYRISNVPTGAYRVSLSLLSQSVVPFYDARRFPDVACHGACPSGEGDVVEIGSESTHELDFALGPAAGLSGRVVDADDGSELAGVELIAFKQRNLSEWEPIHRVRTDADGSYRLDYLPRGSVRLATANAGGYRDQRWPAEPCLQNDCGGGESISLSGGISDAEFNFEL